MFRRRAGSKHFFFSEYLEVRKMVTNTRLEQLEQIESFSNGFRRLIDENTVCSCRCFKKVKKKGER